MKKLLAKIYDYFTDPIYCPRCGTCGHEGCCGISGFLNKHVRGKTDCLYEESMIAEIEWAFKALQEEDLPTPTTDPLINE